MFLCFQHAWYGSLLVCARSEFCYAELVYCTLCVFRRSTSYVIAVCGRPCKNQADKDFDIHIGWHHMVDRWEATTRTHSLLYSTKENIN